MTTSHIILSLILFLQPSYCFYPSSLLSYDSNPVWKNHYEITEDVLRKIGTSNTFVQDIIATASAAPDLKPILANLAVQHVDSEQIIQAISRLKQLKILITQLATQAKYDEARYLLGLALHIVQDFYAHTNWLDYAQSQSINQLSIYSIDQSMVSEPDEPSCAACRNITSQKVILDQLSSLITSSAVYLIRTNLGISNCTAINHAFATKLTSGFSQSVDHITGAVLEPFVGVPKCRHGGLGSESYSGINKDSPNLLLSPHSNKYERAVQAASEASENFINDIRQELNDTASERLLGVKPTRPTTIVMAIDYYIAGSDMFDSLNESFDECIFVFYNDTHYSNATLSIKDSLASFANKRYNFLMPLMEALASSTPGAHLYLIVERDDWLLASDIPHATRARQLIKDKQLTASLIRVVSDTSSSNSLSFDDTEAIHQAVHSLSSGAYCRTSLPDLSKTFGALSRNPHAWTERLLTTHGVANGQIHTLDVDGTIERLIVRVIGQKVKFVLRPHGSDRNDINFDGIEYAGGFLQIALTGPFKPARWSITVTERSANQTLDQLPHYIIVEASSKIKLNVQLYQNVEGNPHPGSVVVTNPIAGDSLWLTVELLGGDDIVGLALAELQFLSGSTSITYALTSLSKSTYVTQIIVPVEPFHILLHGLTVSGAIYRREARRLYTPQFLRINVSPDVGGPQCLFVNETLRYNIAITNVNPTQPESIELLVYDSLRLIDTRFPIRTAVQPNRTVEGQIRMTASGQHVGQLSTVTVEVKTGREQPAAVVWSDYVPVFEKQ